MKKYTFILIAFLLSFNTAHAGFFDFLKFWGNEEEFASASGGASLWYIEDNFIRPVVDTWELLVDSIRAENADFGTLTLDNPLAPSEGGTGTDTNEPNAIWFSDDTLAFNQDGANLSWDDVNDFLGVGTDTPDHNITVAGDVLIDAGYLGFTEIPTVPSGPSDKVRFSASQSPGNDLLTVALLHYDNVDNPDTYINSASPPFPPPQVVNPDAPDGPQQVTTENKFGLASAEYDGNDDYLQLTGAPPVVSGDFTVDFWVNPRDLTNDNYFFASGDQSGDYYAEFVLTSNNDFRYVVQEGGGDKEVNIITPGKILEENVWQHVAVERTGDLFCLFVDGALQGTDIYSGSITNSNLYIQGSDLAVNGPPASNFYNGFIDEFRFSIASRYGCQDFSVPTLPYGQLSGVMTIGDGSTIQLGGGGSVGGTSLWSPQGNDIFRISNVGIGTATPTKPLQVVGETESGFFSAIDDIVSSFVGDIQITTPGRCFKDHLGECALTDITSESLADLSDTNLSVPVNGEYLVNDGANWVNQAFNESLSSLSDVSDTLSPSEEDVFQYISGEWTSVPPSSLGIAQTFLDLTDTPLNYTPQRIPYTNGAGDALVDSDNFKFDGQNLLLGDPVTTARELVVNNNTSSVWMAITSADTGTAGILLGDQTSDSGTRLVADNTDNSLNFYTVNTERMKIESNGFVGINEDEPFGTLQVSNSQTGRTTADPEADEIVVENFANAGINILTDNNGSGKIAFGDFGRANVGAITYDHDFNDMVFTIGLDDDVIFDGTGKAGFGTLDPQAKIHTVGSSELEMTIEALLGNPDMTLAESGDIKGQVKYDVTNNGLAFSSDDSNSGYNGISQTKLFVDGENDRVGVSTADPKGIFHVQNGLSGQATPNGNADELIVEHSGNTGINILSPGTTLQSIKFGDEGSNGAGYVEYNHAGNVMGLGTGGVEQLRINSTGGFGFNTNAPIRKYHFEGEGSSIPFLLRTDNATGMLSDYSNLNSAGDIASRLQSQGVGTFTFGFDRSIDDFIIMNVNNFPSNTADTSKYFRMDRVTGNVGIGAIDPQRDLHIKDILRIEPRATAPAGPGLGDIYQDTSGALCHYNGSAWFNMSNVGSCL